MIRRLFHKLDTTACDAAMDKLEQSQRELNVRARALRMDVSCGAPGEAIERIVSRMRNGAARWLHFFYDDAADASIPPDMRELLERMR